MACLSQRSVALYVNVEPSKTKCYLCCSNLWKTSTIGEVLTEKLL